MTRDTSRFDIAPLPGAGFGAVVAFSGGGAALVGAAEADPGILPRALDDAGGLLVVPGMQAITEAPALLLRLSRLFGPEVENYHRTLTSRNFVHADVPEIFIVSNIPPADRAPPARPDPPLTEDGALPTRFPHRRGWHTDQSYRRPPPDISLFYAAIATPKGQGQTLYANGIAAYAALSDAMKARLEGLAGLHVMPGTGRAEYAVRAGETPRPLRPHERPRAQPVVRVHPGTGQRARFIFARPGRWTGSKAPLSA